MRWSCFLEHAYAKKTDDEISVGNDFLERVISVKDNVARTVCLYNKIDGRREFLESVEFELGIEDNKILTTYDFTYVGHGIEDAVHGGKKLTVHLMNEALFLDIVYELSDGDFYMRKHLVISRNNSVGCSIDRVDVERLGGESFLWRGDVLVPEGLGQPIYIGNMFFGLEYPGAESTFPPLRLRHYPKARINDCVQSKVAVFGVAPKGKVSDWFLHRYLPRIRIRPAKPFIIYNAWHIGHLDLSIERLDGEIEVFRKIFYEKHGLSLDSFALDHGWHDYASIWSVDSRKFPEGFEPLVSRLDGIHTHLGLWLSLPGYLNSLWGKKEGLEVIREDELYGRYCIAGPKYRSRLKEILGYYIKELKVNYFKCDYNDFDCQDPNHGHPVGRPARDAVIDAYIDVLEFINSCNLSIFVALTSGAFLSPWWLMYVDSLWLGGRDWQALTELRSPHPRDLAISYRDKIMYDNFVDKKYQFPTSALMTHGITKGADSLLGAGEPLQKFCDDVMMTLCRGIAKWEMLIDPHVLTDQEWDFLARAFKWAKRNWNLLSRTTMFGGTPEKAEIYGYAHFQGECGIICIRNPSLGTMKAEVRIDENMGLEEKKKEDYGVKLIYPRGMSLENIYRYEEQVELELEGCQVIVAYVGPREQIQKWQGL